MRPHRYLFLALGAALVGGCANLTAQTAPSLPSTARWSLVPMVNFFQTPQAGECSEQILLICSSTELAETRLC